MAQTALPNGNPGGNSNANGNANNANGKNSNLPEAKIKTDEEKDKIERIPQAHPERQSLSAQSRRRTGDPGNAGHPACGIDRVRGHEKVAGGSAAQHRLCRARLTLLRLLPSGEEALKPFGYDLFKGLPSTFAPVSDIQVPLDYIVGPGDTLEVQLFGNEPAMYELTVQRDGRVNFPKLGPIMVSNMNFDEVRSVIERRVSKQLIGTRVSVTMGDLRSIRVFVLGEAEKPGSYTVSGLSTMTNASVRERRV